MADSRDIIVEEDEVDCRLSTWIRRNVRRLIFNSVNTLCRKGLIKVNGIKTKASYRLVMGDVITIPSTSLSATDDGSTPKIDPKLAKLLFEAIILTKSPFLLFETKISTFFEVCLLNAFATSRTEMPLL